MKALPPLIIVVFILLTASMGAQLVSPLGTTDSRTDDMFVGGLSRAVLDGNLYFFWRNGTDMTLYRASGRNLTALSAFEGAGGLTSVEGLLYFSGNDGTNGAEPWRSDGTAAGTFMLQNILSGGRKDHTPSSSPAGFSSLDGKVLFTTRWYQGKGARFDYTKCVKRLYGTDGSAAGTGKISDLDVGPSSSVSRVWDLGNGKGLFWFWSEGSGTEPWITDGTRGGTGLLKDINPGSASSMYMPETLPNVTALEAMTYSDTYGSVVLNGRAYFQADDGIHGSELWVTDGTAGGTVLLADIKSGTGSSYPSMLTVFNGKIYFAADDGDSGVELWCHDPVSSLTGMVADINPSAAGSWPLWLTPLDGKLYFSANSGEDDRELWCYVPGNPATIGEVADINTNGSSDPGYIRIRNQNVENRSEDWDADLNRRFAVLGDALYFAANDGSGFALYRYRSGGASKISCPGMSGLLRPRKITAIPESNGSGLLYFAAFAGGSIGVEWYVYDPDGQVPKRAASAWSADTPLPAEPRIVGNFPNPFNPTTTVVFELPEEDQVRLRVRDILGKDVALLCDKRMPAGTHRIDFSAHDLPSGIYLLQMQYRGTVRTSRMQLVR